VQREVEWDDLWFVPKEHIKRDEQYVRQYDILISTANSLYLVGKVALVRELPYESTLGAFISIIRTPKAINPKFAFYMLSTYEIQSSIRSMASTTTNISNVSTTKLKELNLRLAPLPEQRRIVTKIEELFSRLDAGVEALEKVRAQLKLYRQSVLKAAVEGRLTADWREQHKSELEPASELLKRILAERRKAWETDQLARFKANGKTPKDDKWKKKYKEPEPPDTNDLSDIPDDWNWVYFEHLYHAAQNGLSKRKSNNGIPYKVLRLADIKDNKVIDDNSRTIQLTEEEFNKYGLNKSDILCIRVNGSRNLTGQIIHFDRNDKWAFCDHLIRFFIVSEVVLPEYLFFYFQTQTARQNIEKMMVTTAGQNTVSQPSMASTPVAIPSIEEQKEIIKQIDRFFSITDKIEESLDTELINSEKLRQSILKKAFSGKLVPQDPTDESAEKLLQRIKAEKEKSAKQIRRKKTKGKT